MSALRGIRVLDLTSGLAGSLSAGLMADFGADVVRVVTSATQRRADRPGEVFGDRGKMRMRLSGDSHCDRMTVHGMLERCDIVVVDDSGLAEAFGLKPAAMEGGRRIVLSLPSYREESEAWVGGKESAELLFALSGLATFQSSYSGDPVDAVYPYLLTAQGVWSAVCAIAALIERLSSGKGQRVVVGGAHALVAFVGYGYTRKDGDPDADRAVGPGGLNPLYTRFQASDGQWFFLGALGPKFGRRVLEVTDSLDLVDDPRISGRLDALWSDANTRWVTDRFRDLYASKPASHWVKMFGDADIPVALLNRREEWAEHPQIAANRLRVDAVDGELGRVSMPGLPVSAEKTPGSTDFRRDGFRDGRDDPTVLDQLWPAGSPDATGSARPPRSTGASGPLDGYRVVSLGTYVAGPYGAALLAELGADVIKVESPEGDPWRERGFGYNLGVRSLAVDMRQPGGRDALSRLIETSDVVMNNFRLGVMERLGLSCDRLQQLRPGIVDVAVTAYGEEGPLRLMPGYDVVLQAASGIMYAQGGDDEPVIVSLPIIDHTTAMFGALAAVLALYHSERTGEGQHISASLAATSVFVQLTEQVEYESRPPRRTGGSDFPGPGPLDRFYRVADGFVRIKTETLDPAALRTAGIEVSDAGMIDDPIASLGAALAQLPLTQALERLRAAGVPAVRERSMRFGGSDAELHADGLLSRRSMDTGETYSIIGRMADFSRTPRLHENRPSGLGEYSRAILSEVGVAEDTLDQLCASGAIVHGSRTDVTFMPPYR